MLVLCWRPGLPVCMPHVTSFFWSHYRRTLELCKSHVPLKSLILYSSSLQLLENIQSKILIGMGANCARSISLNFFPRFFLTNIYAKFIARCLHKKHMASIIAMHFVHIYTCTDVHPFNILTWHNVNTCLHFKTLSTAISNDMQSCSVWKCSFIFHYSLC